MNANAAKLHEQANEPGEEVGSDDATRQDLALAAMFEASANEGVLTPLEATLGTAFLVAYADGSASAAEMELVKRMVQTLLAPEVPEQELVQKTSESMLNVGIADRDAYLALILRSLPEPGARAAAFLVATAVSWADGEVNAEERGVLERLAEAFGLPVSAVDLAIEKVQRIFPAG